MGQALILLTACGTGPAKAPSPQSDPAPPAQSAAKATSKAPSATAKPGPPTLGLVGTGHLPQSLAGSAVTSCGQVALVLGGLHSSASTTTLLSVSAAGKATPAGSLPFATHDAAAACIGGVVYLFGGGIGTTGRDTLASLTPTAGGKWAFKRLGTLQTPLSDLSAVSVGGRAYLIGGFDGKTYSSAVLRYTPGQSRPSAFAHLPVGLRYGAVAATSDAIYLFGGLTPGGRTRAIYKVSLANGHVSQVGLLPHALQYAAAATLDGAIWVVGGLTSQGHFLSTVQRFDPKTAKLSPALTLPAPFAYGGIAALGHRLLLVGGTHPGGGVDTIWVLQATAHAPGGSG